MQAFDARGPVQDAGDAALLVERRQRETKSFKIAFADCGESASLPFGDKSSGIVDNAPMNEIAERDGLIGANRG